VRGTLGSSVGAWPRVSAAAVISGCGFTEIFSFSEWVVAQRGLPQMARSQRSDGAL
jgi:hypothetical protein